MVPLFLENCFLSLLTKIFGLLRALLATIVMGSGSPETQADKGIGGSG